MARLPGPHILLPCYLCSNAESGYAVFCGDCAETTAPFEGESDLIAWLPSEGFESRSRGLQGKGERNDGVKGLF